MEELTLDQLQNKVDMLVVKINSLMGTIMQLDKYCDESDESEESYNISMVILQKGEEFEACMSELESAINIFLKKQQDLNLPINMSYTRLRKQIQKARA